MLAELSSMVAERSWMVAERSRSHIIEKETQ